MSGTLREFLVAQFETEEAETLRAVERHRDIVWAAINIPGVRFDGAPVGRREHIRPEPWMEHRLAECEGRRRIADLVGRQSWNDLAAQDIILQALALPYMDHPDWQAEWGREWRP
jgi:hypothetical protein